MKNILFFLVSLFTFIAGGVDILKGTPGETGWDNVAPMKFFRWKEAGEPPMETRAQFMYDDNQLYIRIFCTEPNISEARSKPVLKRDGNVWENDCVEIFVDLCDNSSRIYQFVCDIHNVNAELVWNDPAFANRITWNGYWHSKVTYFDTAFIVDAVIPWRTLGITSASGRKIAINLNRYRSIHPWGRYVLAEKTEKLLDSSKFLHFGPINVSAPALEAKVSPAAAAISGTNVVDWELKNVSNQPLTGEVQLIAVTSGGSRILAGKKISINGNGIIRNSFEYIMNEVGTFPVKLSFVSADGKAADLWADSIVFNSPLECAQQYLTAVKGEDCEIFVRNYLPVKKCDISVEISDLSGKKVEVLKQSRQSSEFFLTVPCKKLPDGRYTVTVKYGVFREKLKLLIVPALL